jgi:hypothetical protein
MVAVYSPHVKQNHLCVKARVGRMLYVARRDDLSYLTQSRLSVDDDISVKDFSNIF